MFDEIRLLDNCSITINQTNINSLIKSSINSIIRNSTINVSLYDGSFDHKFSIIQYSENLTINTSTFIITLSNSSYYGVCK